MRLRATQKQPHPLRSVLLQKLTGFGSFPVVNNSYIHGMSSVISFILGAGRGSGLRSVLQGRMELFACPPAPSPSALESFLLYGAYPYIYSR